MALFGLPGTVRAQLRYPTSLDSVWAYVQAAVTPGHEVQRRILGVAVGKTERVDLADGAFALEQAYVSKRREHALFESHKAYIDFQLVISGEELMEVLPLAKGAAAAGMVVKDDFTPERDLLFYQQAGRASQLWVRAGDLAVFFPDDAHRPSLALEMPTQVWKTVIKIPVR